MKNSSSNGERVIETSPIRLTADETRAIMKAAASNGKPITDYRVCELVNLGIMRAVDFPAKDFTSETKDLWFRISKAVREKDDNEARRALNRLSEIERMTKKQEKGHVLTDLGKQIARGITVRLNGQYKSVAC